MVIFGREISIEQLDGYLDYVRRYQRYVYILVVGLILLQFALVFIRPRLVRYSDMKSQYSKAEVLLNQQRKEVLNKEKIEQELGRLQRILKGKQELFFSEDQLSQFSINTLPKLARSFGNEVQSIGYNASRQLDYQVSAHPLRLSLDGEFFGVLQFIDALEHYQQVVKVNSFSLSRKSVKPLKLTAAIEVDVYEYKP